MTYKNGIVSVWENGEIIATHNVIWNDDPAVYADEWAIVFCFYYRLTELYNTTKIKIDDTGAWNQTDFNIFLEDEVKGE